MNTHQTSSPTAAERTRANLLQYVQRWGVANLQRMFPKMCEEDVHDVVQDTCIKIWTMDDHQLSSLYNIQAWSKRVMCNQVLSLMKHKRFTMPIPVDDMKIPDRRAAREYTEVENRVLLEQITGGQPLPEIIVQHDVQGMTYRQIRQHRRDNQQRNRGLTGLIAEHTLHRRRLIRAGGGLDHE